MVKVPGLDASQRRQEENGYNWFGGMGGLLVMSDIQGYLRPTHVNGRTEAQSTLSSASYEYCRSQQADSKQSLSYRAVTTTCRAVDFLTRDTGR